MDPRMSKFDYVEPRTLEEVLELIHERSNSAKVIAGGTDLIVDYLKDVTPAAYLIGLLGLDDLAKIEINDDLYIGSTVTLNMLTRSATIQANYPMLAESAGLVGSRQIRNLATIGGNICNAVPSADTAPPLLAADADVLISSKDSRRAVPIMDFFLGPRKTILKGDELVIGFTLPTVKPNTGSVYRRHTPRRALDLAMVGVAVSLTMDPEARVVDRVRLALGAVAPIPYRVTEVENLLSGESFSEAIVEEAADIAANSASPISDIRGSKTYREEIIRVLTRQCLLEAATRCENTSGDLSHAT
jgi:carbon-monoxide dehydrogenase medium subunit